MGYAMGAVAYNPVSFPIWKCLNSQSPGLEQLEKLSTNFCKISLPFPR